MVNHATISDPDSSALMSALVNRLTGNLTAVSQFLGQLPRRLRLINDCSTQNSISMLIDALLYIT